jgi:hypothetical protein
VKVASGDEVEAEEALEAEAEEAEVDLVAEAGEVLEVRRVWTVVLEPA